MAMQLGESGERGKGWLYGLFKAVANVKQKRSSKKGLMCKTSCLVQRKSTKTVPSPETSTVKVRRTTFLWEGV